MRRNIVKDKEITGVTKGLVNWDDSLNDTCNNDNSTYDQISISEQRINKKNSMLI